MSAVRTTCPYCGVGCGVMARATDALVEISGDPQHPANFGRLCSKGAALADTLGAKGRLLYPQVRGSRVSWDEALRRVSEGFTRTVAEHGPDAVAFYLSGQLLTEDYYVANKLMKGFVGSANIDTNSRLCMASAVAAHQRAFGEDLVPGCYEDFDLADLIVLAGSNTAWCHPVLFQRLIEARERRPSLKIVAIDPRRTPTCELADLHLPVRSGTDVWLFNGLLSYLHTHGFAEAAFVDAHTEGLSAALAAAESCKDHLKVARACGIDAERTLQFFRLFAATPKVVTAFSQGVNQSSSGTDKANSIINCHLLTGRLGLPGAGPFSLTGQPNAMGGREVGGMATALAAHMSLSNTHHRELVQGFWIAPHIASRQGLKAVELFEAIYDRRVKAVWIMATNPVVSLPDADRVRAALARCPLVVVSDCVEQTDTTVFAHVLLPAATWSEKDGTVTNSERRISRQRSFRTPPGEARPDWWIVSETAKRMGFSEAFPYQTPHEIFTEHARLSGVANEGSRLFDISGLADLTPKQYDELTPVQWPVPAAEHPGTARLFADRKFSNRGARGRFAAVVPRAPAHGCDDEYPWVLNTGRVRDQWHTMTRTGLSPRLSEHRCEPFVDLHAQDALLAGVRVGELVRVTTSWGSLIARVRTSGEMARGAAFVPIHWNAANSSQARVGAVVSPAVDPISGEPEFKHTPVRVEPFIVDWYGFILSRRPLPDLNVTWWTRVQGPGVTRYEVAGRGVPRDWATWSRELLGATEANADYLEYCDVGAGSHRAAHLVQERLEAYLCVARRPDLPERGWLMELFSRDRLCDGDRFSLLAGRAFGGTKNAGALVCSCFGVGRNELVRAIEQGGLTDARAIGLQLKAGTGCGSCLPELKALIRATAHEPSPVDSTCPPGS